MNDFRYCYCAVRLEDESDDGNDRECGVAIDSGEEVELDVRGIDDTDVRVVSTGDVGAVVHSCDGLYDSEDTSTVRRWLTRHQTVVDAAGERFGTPLPFRFDTVVDGDDDDVRTWLAGLSEIEQHLDTLANSWEYRIEVRATQESVQRRLDDEDERLESLRKTIDAADSGESFLRKKQYDRRLDQARQSYRESRIRDLRIRLEPHVTEIRDLDSSSSVSSSSDDQTEQVTVASLAVRAPVESEDPVGRVLDDIATEDGVEVRYSGPWPPYSFAPDLGGQ